MQILVYVITTQKKSSGSQPKEIQCFSGMSQGWHRDQKLCGFN